MLLTYLLQKFRKAAPALVVLQLLAFCIFFIYQKYSESEIPDFDEYSWILNENNAVRWNELEFEDFFEAEIRLMQRAEFIPQWVSVSKKNLEVNGYARSVNPQSKLLKTTVDGVSTYKVEAKEVGKHTINANITTKSRTGEMRTYTSECEYTVLPKCN